MDVPREDVHPDPDSLTPADLVDAERIADEAQAEIEGFLGVAPGELIERVWADRGYELRKTSLREVLDSRTRLKAELAAWYERDSADAAAGSYARRAENAEAQCERLTAEADRRLKDWESAWAERNEARGSVRRLADRLPIEELGLDPRTRAILGLSHIRFVGELLRMTEENVTDLRNSGVKTLENVKDRLHAQFGLTLADDRAKDSCPGAGDSAVTAPITET